MMGYQKIQRAKEEYIYLKYFKIPGVGRVNTHVLRSHKVERRTLIQYEKKKLHFPSMDELVSYFGFFYLPWEHCTDPQNS